MLFCAENMEIYDINGIKINKQLKYRGFDSDSYCFMLQNHALPSIQKMMKNEKFYFIQDNASIHTAKTKDKNEK